MLPVNSTGLVLRRGLTGGTSGVEWELELKSDVGIGMHASG